jgi:hypothetical protein
MKTLALECAFALFALLCGAATYAASLEIYLMACGV